MEHESEDYNNHDWCFWYSHQRIIKGTGGLGGRRTSGNHRNYNIIENGQNTEKSLGDLGGLAVTQIPMKNYQLKLMWKTLKRVNNNNNNNNRKQKCEGKQLYGRFKRLIKNISHDKTWTGLRKGNSKRETKSLLMAAQNNAIRTNHIKARIDKTQQNRKCKLCGNRDETINHIISECSKLAQKEYKARHGWEGKVICWEMY